MPTLQVRDLPDYIYQQIVELAESERRSITQETIILLEKALEIEKQNKYRSKELLDQIIKETESEYNKDFPNPVKLIREDRDRW